jgi:hypothetical protein
MLVAPVAANASVLLVPSGMLVGLAVNEVMIGSGTVTVTLAVAVTEPLGLVAVSVYVVVAVGVTTSVPLTAVDVNVPGVMATLVAFVVANASVLLDPVVMPAGLAVNELICGIGAVTVTVRVDFIEPAAFVAVSV